MKIAYNGRFLAKEEPGGAMKVAQKVFEHMVQLDKSSQFVLLSPAVKRRLDCLNRANVQVRGNRGMASKMSLLDSVGAALWEQLAVPGLLAKIEPDLYHTTMNGTVFTGAVPTVVTVHDLGYENREWFSGTFSRWYRFIVPRVLRRAGKVVAVSEFTKSEVTSRFDIPAERVEVIYNGVDEYFRSEGVSGSLEASSWKSLPERFVLFVGSLNPRKNLRRTVGAFLSAKRENLLPHKLLIAGADKEIFAESGVEETRGVQTLGYVKLEELKYLYERAELTLFPSLYEGFGLPPLESMACGTPVITSDRASLPEVVGEAALKVDPLDEEEMAQEIYRVLSDPGLREQLARRGKKRAKRFCWEETARKTLKVYRDLLEEG